MLKDEKPSPGKTDLKANVVGIEVTRGADRVGDFEVRAFETCLHVAIDLLLSAKLNVLAGVTSSPTVSAGNRNAGLGVDGVAGRLPVPCCDRGEQRDLGWDPSKSPRA